jgi:hypothetical protein
MGKPYNFDQDSFRGRDDTQTLNSSTFTHDLNTGWTQDVDEVFRVRFLIQETNGGDTGSKQFKWQYNTGSGYTDVSGTSPLQWANSGQYADDDATTQVLGSGSFTAGDGSEGDNITTSVDVTANNETEFEGAFYIDSAQVDNNDTIDLRMVESDGTVFIAYTNTPTITVSEAGTENANGDATTAVTTSSSVTKTTSVDGDATTSVTTDRTVTKTTSAEGTATTSVTTDKTLEVTKNIDGEATTSVTTDHSITKTTSVDGDATAAVTTEQSTTKIVDTEGTATTSITTDKEAVVVKPVDGDATTAVTTSESVTKTTSLEEGPTTSVTTDKSVTKIVSITGTATTSVTTDKTVETVKVVEDDATTSITTAHTVTKVAPVSGSATSGVTTDQTVTKTVNITGQFQTAVTTSKTVEGVTPGGVNANGSSTTAVTTEESVTKVVNITATATTSVSTSNTVTKTAIVNGEATTSVVTLDTVYIPPATILGDCGVWREAGGASSYNSTSWSDFSFDTEVEADGSFGQSGGSSTTDFEMPKGHTLVIHSHGYRGNSGSNRAGMYIGLELDGADIEYGRAMGYIRYVTGADHQDCTPIAATIINVASDGDILTSRTKRFDNNSGAGVVDVAGRSSIQCIKLDDNRGYFRAKRTTAKNTSGIYNGAPGSLSALNSSGNWGEVDWDAPDEAISGFSLDGGAGTSEIILPVGARVLVCYGVQFHLTSGTDRRGGITRLQTRDGAGGSWTTVANSHGSAYCRGQSSIDYGYGNCIKIIDTSGMTSPRLRLQFIEENESGSRLLEYTEAYITIGELPDVADYMFINTDAAETTFTNTVTNVTFEATPTEMDTNSFAYPAATTMQLKKANKYLFLAQFGTERTTLNQFRKEPEFRWYINTSYTNTGYFSEFNRGSDGSGSGCLFGMGGGGLIWDATVDDWVSLRHLCQTQNDPRDCQAPIGYISIQAINLQTAKTTHVYMSGAESVNAAKRALLGTVVGAMTASCGATDSNRGGLLVADSSHVSDLQTTNSYHPHSINYPDNVVRNFPTSTSVTRIYPIADRGPTTYSTQFGASTIWQCLAQDPYDSSDTTYVFGDSPVVPVAFGNFFVGTTSVPNNMTGISTLTGRVRVVLNNTHGGAEFRVRFNHPSTGDEYSEYFNYPQGSNIDTVEEFTITGFNVDADVFNDNLSFMGISWSTDPNDTIKFYAMDMLVHAYTEKSISEEVFNSKPVPDSSFSGGKSIGGETWDEKDSDSPVFDPS